jgi:hypothetical protein
MSLPSRTQVENGRTRLREAACVSAVSGDSVQPVLLAILWTLDNRRIACELSKVDTHAWQLRVVASGAELRRDVFGDLPLTLRTAQNWRDEFSRTVKIA